MIDKIFDIIKKEDKKFHLQHAVYESVPFGILLAVVGGFLDTYTFLERGGVFANAQTGNIVLLGIYGSKGEWKQALTALVPIAAFVVGVIVAEAIKNNSSHLFVLDWARAVLLLEITVLFIVGFIPKTVPNIVVTVIISFVSSIQIASFRKLVDSPYSTTMSTGNLRSASQWAYTAFTQKDSEAAIRAIRFFTIIFSFLLGAFLGGVFTILIGIRSIWCTVLILISSALLLNIDEQKNKE